VSLLYSSPISFSCLAINATPSNSVTQKYDCSFVRTCESRKALQAPSAKAGAARCWAALAVRDLIVTHFRYALVLFARTGLRYRTFRRWLNDNNIGTYRNWRGRVSPLAAGIDNGPSLIVSLKVWPITRCRKFGACR